MAPALVRKDLNIGGLTGGSWEWPSQAASVAWPSETYVPGGLGSSGLTTGDGSLPGHGGGIVPSDGKLRLTHDHPEPVANNDSGSNTTSTNTTTATTQPASGSMLRRKAGVGAVVLGIGLSVLSA